MLATAWADTRIRRRGCWQGTVTQYYRAHMSSRNLPNQVQDLQGVSLLTYNRTESLPAQSDHVLHWRR